MSKKNIFLRFIEEMVMNPEYLGYVGGRIGVYHPGDVHASEEIRFLTKQVEDFNAFRERWDFRDITPFQLKHVRRMVDMKFYEEINFMRRYKNCS